MRLYTVAGLFSWTDWGQSWCRPNADHRECHPYHPPAHGPTIISVEEVTRRFGAGKGIHSALVSWDL